MNIYFQKRGDKEQKIKHFYCIVKLFFPKISACSQQQKWTGGRKKCLTKPTCQHDKVEYQDIKNDFKSSYIEDIPRVRLTTYGKNSFQYIVAV